MIKSILAAAVLAAGAFAQTETDCQPLAGACPPDPAIGMSNWTYTFANDISATNGQVASTSNPTVWNNTGSIAIPVENGIANFTMTNKGEAPTLQTAGYLFFGTASVMLKAAKGRGVITAITMLSDDLDEIDFEFVGGNTSVVSCTFFGKHGWTGPQGQGMQYGAGQNVTLDFDASLDFHNYTFNWQKTGIQWIVDGKVVREVASNDPLTRGPNPNAQLGFDYPQTPMRFKVGTWSGGDSPNAGTVSWAGGKTDWSQGPFTVAAKSVYISDAGNGMQYSYKDTSGSEDSIVIKPGTSVFSQAAAQQASADSSSGSSDGSSNGPSLTQKAKSSFDGLSSGAKIGIAAGVLGAVAVSILAFSIFCCKQRRLGRKERALGDAEFQKQEAELMAYRQENAGKQQFAMPGFGNQSYQNRL